VIHFASPSFWSAYEVLPSSVKRVADRNFEILKTDPKHPSLHFKRIKHYWSIRAGIRYRALAIEIEDDLLWF
jgi:hypothetical protein